MNEHWQLVSDGHKQEKKLTNSRKDAVKAEEWVRDGAVVVNRDEKELISDLRKGLLTGDNDAVIRWETAMLNPVHAIKSGQSLSHCKSPPTPTTNGEVETN